MILGEFLSISTCPRHPFRHAGRAYYSLARGCRRLDNRCVDTGTVGRFLRETVDYKLSLLATDQWPGYKTAASIAREQGQQEVSPALRRRVLFPLQQPQQPRH